MALAKPTVQPRIRCRKIMDADLDGVVNLLSRGFGSSREFWSRALARLSRHPAPAGFPRYGYMLEADGEPVGVFPMIFSEIEIDGEKRIRCNVSSWYVEPEFRVHASMMASYALNRHKDTTYFVITPLPHTRSILEAQGYERYCEGRYDTMPALGRRVRGARVTEITPDIAPGDDLDAATITLLQTHAAYGCISAICTHAGRRHPFIFARHRKSRVIPYATLVYCRDMSEVARFAGPLGRFLLRRGLPLLVLDSNGPIKGLLGRYSDENPKYFKGPDRPRLGDLAYSKRVFFGV